MVSNKTDVLDVGIVVFGDFKSTDAYSSVTKVKLHS